MKIKFQKPIKIEPFNELSDSEIDMQLKEILFKQNRKQLIFYPTQCQGKTRINNVLDKILNKGWKSLAREEKFIITELVNNNPPKSSL